jgi:hypothetical protein
MATFTKTCFYCKREFEATYSLANICSPDCQKRARTSGTGKAQPNRFKSGAKPAKSKLTKAGQEARGYLTSCRRCGKAMWDATCMRRYCSSTCRKAMHRERRKEMLRRAYVESVSMAELRRRDDDTCRICGKPVDFTRQPPDPSAATIDHVIAVSRGGEHSYKNTQLAHLRCNTAKGAG